MKFKTVASILVGTSLLAACGSNVDTVKDGILKGYESLTVGQALDNYRNCTPGTQKWTEFETENGMNIVQFSCQDSTIMAASDRLSKKYAKDKSKQGQRMLNIVALSDAQNVFQFSLHKSGDGFELQYSGTTLTWKDNKTHSEKDGDLFDTFYKNEDVMSQVESVPFGMQMLDQTFEVAFSVRRNFAK